MHATTETAPASAAADELDLMALDRSHHQAWVGRLAARLGLPLSGDVSGYFGANYDHELGEALSTINGRVAVESVTWSVKNPGLARDRAMIGAGLSYDLARNVQFNVDAKGGTSASYSYNAGMRIVF
jgi:outer membrane autotransporter protein